MLGLTRESMLARTATDLKEFSQPTPFEVSAGLCLACSADDWSTVWSVFPIDVSMKRADLSPAIEYSHVVSLTPMESR